MKAVTVPASLRPTGEVLHGRESNNVQALLVLVLTSFIGPGGPDGGSSKWGFCKGTARNWRADIAHRDLLPPSVIHPDRKLVKDAYQSLVTATANAGRPLPENKPLRGSRELLLRYLDCATINLCTELRKKTRLPAFDTVRAAFIEGEPLYKNAGFCDRNHIQVCVLNHRNIKGYFRPLK
jgi:hypothetical protein